MYLIDCNLQQTGLSCQGELNINVEGKMCAQH